MLDAQLPGGAECAREHVFVGRCEDDVRRSMASPTASDGQEDFGPFVHEPGLRFRREHQVAVAFVLMRESGEDSAADAEVWRTHVRAFFDAVELEGEPAKVRDGH